MSSTISRRTFLRAGAAGIAATALPTFLRFRPEEGLALATSSGARFFTEEQYATISAAVSRLIPDDQDPGAGPAKVADYIDFLLAAFDTPGTPCIYAGGPFSDRNPVPDAAFCDGASVPTRGTQVNDMATFVPLSRRERFAWRVRLFGTAELATGEFFAEVARIRANNKALGQGDDSGDLKGLRQLYREGIDELDAFARDFGAEQGFSDLDPIRQELVLNFSSNQEFVQLLFGHAVEGMYANPEYGGNQPADLDQPIEGADGTNRPLGWSYIGFEGDRQPLGYTIFVSDPATCTPEGSCGGSYCELPDHPVSGPNRVLDAVPLDAETIAALPELVRRLRVRR